MDFDNSAQVDALAKLPPEPAKPPERSAWSLIPRFLAGGAGKVGAAIVEGVANVSPDEAEIRRNPGSTAISSETLDSIARSARDFERSLRPDPATASTAEQIVYGLGSGLTEAAAGAVIGGPFGAAAALGVGEGAVLTDDLQRQGVDDTTARLAGGVGGVVNAASVALPLAGPTLKATAGLYLLGGPAGFMGQQAATRAILENADYSTIGAQFDPFDPVGLALSALIPLPFAAHGAMRNIRAGKKSAPEAGTATAARDLPAEVPKMPPEAVDAAMVHNLTLLRGAQEAVQERVRVLGPAEVLRAETETRIADLQAQRAELLPDAGALAGRGEIRAAREELKALEQAKPADTPEAIRERAKEIQAEERVSYKAALSTATKEIAGRVADHAAAVARVTDFIETNARAQQAVGKIAELDQSIARLQQEVQYLQAGQRAAEPLQQAQAAPVRADADVTQPAPEPPPDAAVQAARPATPDPVVTPDQAAPATPAAPPDFGRLTAAVTHARDLFDKHGKAIDQYLATNEVPPEVNNLLIGLSEAGKDPKRVAAFLDIVAKQDGAKSAADATADAVEGMRSLTDEQLTNTEPDTFKPAIDPLMQSISDRVAAVRLAAPDMVVGLDASGNPITVADEIARIRKEVIEGTDTELGAADADLVTVAANCALSVGA